jgi:hypothetical protein
VRWGGVCPPLGARVSIVPGQCISHRLLHSPNILELRQGEVRRIPIPRTPVNKGKKKGREPTWAPGSLRSNFRLRAVLLVPGAYARALVRPA